ncbi:MAG: DNA-directed RNA polymerase subunit D [archaeon]|nr:DNA-directed RNA polymerase subunit D [Nanoarchaeota archaeon]
MKLKKVSEDKKNMKLSFELNDCDEAFANAIRRTIMEEVPTLAIEDIEVKENSSALYDEMLALRIGLTPIKTDLSSYRLPKNEDEIKERAAGCTLQMGLKVAKKGYVYAEEATSKDTKCTFVYPKMPLVKLAAKQKVDLLMYAVMGQGKDHIKWSPGMAWFYHQADVKVNQKVNLIEQFKHKYPPQIFDKSGKIVKEKIVELNLFDAVEGICDNLIQVTFQDNQFIFNVESWGQLTCQKMLEESANILLNKVEELEAQIK